MRPFAEIGVGDTESIVKVIDEADVRRFVQLTGDDNPLHVDRDYAERTPFKDVVVHGMIGASLVSTVVGTRLPGEGALWVSQSFNFVRPVRLGDKLTVSCTVLKKNERERLLELDARVVNQHAEVVLSGQGQVKVLEAEAEQAVAEPGARVQVALVTGGSGGIGQAVCRRLAAEGYAVAVGFHREERRAAHVVEEIQADDGRAIAVPIAAGEPGAAERVVERVVRELGGISLLVNGASPRIGAKPLDALEWKDLSDQLEVQLGGAFSLVKAVAPRMREQGHGRIVSILSQAIEGSATPGWTAYAVAKGALATFSRQLAAELGPAGITVNCVAPGMTDTRMIGDIPEKQRLIVARQTPLRRLASPEDVAGAVAYLASEQAAFVTGETLRVNGGQVMA